jgi:hypothetical protein
MWGGSEDSHQGIHVVEATLPVMVPPPPLPPLGNVHLQIPAHPSSSNNAQHESMDNADQPAFKTRFVAQHTALVHHPPTHTNSWTMQAIKCNMEVLPRLQTGARGRAQRRVLLPNQNGRWNRVRSLWPGKYREINSKTSGATTAYFLLVIIPKKSWHPSILWCGPCVEQVFKIGKDKSTGNLVRHFFRHHPEEHKYIMSISHHAKKEQKVGCPTEPKTPVAKQQPLIAGPQRTVVSKSSKARSPSDEGALNAARLVIILFYVCV